MFFLPQANMDNVLMKIIIYVILNTSYGQYIFPSLFHHLEYIVRLYSMFSCKGVFQLSVIPSSFLNRVFYYTFFTLNYFHFLICC